MTAQSLPKGPMAGFGRETPPSSMPLYYMILTTRSKSYGQRALPLIVRQICAQRQSRRVYVTLEKENQRAVHLYKKFGFHTTGEMDEDETVYAFEMEA